ncbi:MAG: alkaline phosphatase PhoX, partial [Vicinamibacteria bacterium]
MRRARHSRRSFLLGGLATTALAPFTEAPFEALRRLTEAEEVPRGMGYGPLAPVSDETSGLPLLQLPEGFRYRSYGWTGDPLDGAHSTPSRHDGMAVVATAGRQAILVRNHEVRDTTGSFGPPALTYDPAAGGGTSSLVFDTTSGKWLSSRVSLAGTSTNCAGGPTPWGSWLTCEETIAEAGESSGVGGKPLDRNHGFVFEVPGSGNATGKPLLGLGRFVHEAIAVDPATGIVYETEDASMCGFYRFLPQQRGRLEASGTLQMLSVREAPRVALDGDIEGGRRFGIQWIDIDDPRAVRESVFAQGYAKGGAAFTRLEGAWYDRGLVYFTST